MRSSRLPRQRSSVSNPLALSINEVEAYTRLAGVYDEIVVDPCYSLWADFLDDLWGGESPGVRRVLDVCCGTGLMAAELAERGYRVVGVDSASAMLDRARQLLGPDVHLIEATLPDLGTDEVFDAAVSTFDGLNYLTPDDFRASIAAIATRLRPGGWLVFDLHTDAMMKFTIANPVVSGISDGNEFEIRSDVDTGSRTCTTTIDVTRPRIGDPFTERHRQYFHSSELVRDGLIVAGFTGVRVTHEYTHEPLGSQSLRATWSARKELG